ncbi:uncharacterized protein [Palaemon carinicauda]|uniref:uncharacterized protein n=1 Tax=Palaemon carinicauda TaxID=392227 RepID=UPI0035B69624
MDKLIVQEPEKRKTLEIEPCSAPVQREIFSAPVFYAPVDNDVYSAPVNNELCSAPVNELCSAPVNNELCSAPVVNELCSAPDNNELCSAPDHHDIGPNAINQDRSKETLPLASKPMNNSSQSPPENRIGDGTMDSISEVSREAAQTIYCEDRRLPDSSQGLYLTLSKAPINFDRLQNLKDQLPNVFPPEVCSKIAVSLRDSSLHKYENLYNIFKSFIHKEYGRDNKFPLLAIILFFNHLIDKGLSYNTLKSYRAALGPILSGYFPGYCLAEDKYVKAMISGANRRKPRNSHQFPGWDLDKVISFLNTTRDNSTLLLTQKTLFLVALACPLRANQFNNLSISRSTFTPEHIVLRNHPSFMAKNQKNNYTPIEISFRKLPNRPKICPVRQLNFYLEYTNKVCMERNIDRKDHIWLDEHFKIMSLQKMRQLFRECIFRADPNATKQSTNFHSIRGQASSRLLYNGVSIQEIMSRMNWRSDSVFSSYYALLGLQGAFDAVVAGLHLQAP